METTVQTERTGSQPMLQADVLRYLEAVRAEQNRFLESVALARMTLEHSTGQLGQVSAVQGRLTRQFFDAQRSLLQRRAEIDAEVQRIAAETEAHANVVLASAVAHAAAGEFAPPSAADVCADAHAPAVLSQMERVEQSTRQAIAALGVLAVRTKADSDALEQVINEAFAAAEPDAARMERELQHVLDTWWTSEMHEGKALIEDARARAAMRLHLAHLEACEIAGAATPAPVNSAEATASLLPAAVIQTLETADASSLDDVFAALARSLAPTAVPQSVPEQLRVAPPRIVGTSTLEPIAPIDQFQHFWHHEPTPTVADEHAFSLLSVLRRIVFPMCAVTSGLALLLALIG